MSPVQSWLVSEVSKLGWNATELVLSPVVLTVAEDVDSVSARIFARITCMALVRFASVLAGK